MIDPSLMRSSRLKKPNDEPERARRDSAGAGGEVPAGVLSDAPDIDQAFVTGPVLVPSYLLLVETYGPTVDLVTNFRPV